jgi:hypothetical protein
MDVWRVKKVALGALELSAVAAFMGAVFVWADALRSWRRGVCARSTD